MTYEKLIEMLKELPPERLQDTVTVYVCDDDEFYDVQWCDTATEKTDVLDPGHFYLEI